MIAVNFAGMAGLFAVDCALIVVLPRRQADGWTAVVAGALVPVYGLLGFGFLEGYCLLYCAIAAWQWRHEGGAL